MRSLLKVDSSTAPATEIEAQSNPGLNDAQLAAIGRAVRRFGFGAKAAADFMRKLQSAEPEMREILLCAADRQYFVNTYCRIYDAQALEWIPFHLWPEQAEVLDMVHDNQFVVVLKARQLGLSWLLLAYALWQMLFAPIATIMIYSRRDDEAIYLLGEERLKGMYKNLPDFLKARAVEVSSAHQFKLSNGSVAYAFPTTAGDSYTATLVIMDEADLLPNINRLMQSVKPTVDAGGKLVMISRSDKSKPDSMFKNTYRKAKAGRNGWAAIFLPWWVRPERDAAWYERMKADMLERTGSLDGLYESYPATDDEAMRASSLNKRIPSEWLEKCYRPLMPFEVEDLPDDCPYIPDLRIYRLPEPGEEYVGGVDCAEGLVTSNDSVTTLVNRRTGEQVAVLAGKITPAMHAAYSLQLARWYHDARLLIENNNHGHSFILWMNDNGGRSFVLKGHNGKAGWSSNSLGKALMYTTAAEAARDQQFMIFDEKTYLQLQSIEKSTLLAPEGDMDDHADAFALAQQARITRSEADNIDAFGQTKVNWK